MHVHPFHLPLAKIKCRARHTVKGPSQSNRREIRIGPTSSILAPGGLLTSTAWLSPMLVLNADSDLNRTS